MILGHFALAFILKQALPVESVPLLVGSLCPDVVDKTLYVTRRVYGTRTYGHTLLGLLVSSGILYLGWGHKTAGSWALGYLGHLLADADGFLPWFYPFMTHAYRHRSRSCKTQDYYWPTLPEWVLISWAITLILLRIWRRK